MPLMSCRRKKNYSCSNNRLNCYLITHLDEVFKFVEKADLSLILGIDKVLGQDYTQAPNYKTTLE